MAQYDLYCFELLHQEGNHSLSQRGAKQMFLMLQQRQQQSNPSCCWQPSGVDDVVQNTTRCTCAVKFLQDFKHVQASLFACSVWESVSTAKCTVSL